MTNVETEALVIGGGATGAGVVRDLGMRGIDAVLVDRGDLAGGTSGRFHGLLHSGARYAVNDPLAAAECQEESRILRRIAAGCIEDTGGYFVETPWDGPEYAGAFTEGCRRAAIACEEVPVAEALRREPRLHPGIRRVFAVPDASIDPLRTVRANAHSATAHGARILPQHPVVRLLLDGRRVAGAVVHDRLGGEDVAIRARITVNAAGAWAGRIAAMAGCEVTVVAGKGVLVAVDHRLVNTVINRCRPPGDGDIIVPIGTLTVLGTTDAPSPDPDRFDVTRPEMDLVLDEGEKLLPGFRHAGAQRAWAGVRALFQKAGPAGAGGDRELPRAHHLLDHRTRDGVDGLVTITGGKFTTYRRMAEQTVDLVALSLGVDRPCATAQEPLPAPEAGPSGWAPG